MTEKAGIRVAVVGLGFGAEFVPIYLQHPNVTAVAISDKDTRRLDEVGDRFRIRYRLRRFDEVLASSDLDAVHLITGIPQHAEQAIVVLESGKHCACTVPMATSIEGLRAIVAAQRKSGRNYMMMETSVYTRHFFYVKAMLARGDMGAIQFLRGAHYQDMGGWPPYWAGLPPMHYSTHAVSPLLALAGTRATSVCCFGSGRMRPELRKQYGNPFPIETAIFQLEGTDVSAEVTRSLFHTAKAYVESFDVLCDKMSFQWAVADDGPPVLHRIGEFRPGLGRPVTVEQVEPPDRADLLPPPIGRFTRRTVYDESDPHLSFLQGGGHHGSHPHLVNEFVMAIVEQRKPWIDAVTAANWTAPGICAHESAMDGGRQVEIPASPKTGRHLDDRTACMNLRENYLEAVRFGQPEHVPLANEPIIHSLEFEGNFRTEDWTDLWGVRWEVGLAGTVPFPKGNPLPSLDRLSDYAFPAADRLIFGDDMRQGLRSVDRSERLVVGHLMYLLFERAWAIMGMDNFLMGLVTHPGESHAFLHGLATFARDVFERYLELGVDGVRFSEDLGNQRALMISPAMFREFILPEYVFCFEHVLREKKMVMFHSCGCVDAIAADLAGIGVTVLNPVQARANDLHKVKADSLGRMALSGAIDTSILARGTPEEVRTEVIRVMEILKPGGGYVCGPDQSIPGIAAENLNALWETAREVGRY